MMSTYQNIWFCGLAASGKTTILKLLSKGLLNVEFLNDSQEILEFIANDHEELHHSKPTPNTFLLTDSAATYYSVNQILRKIDATPQKKIIELSRGKDREGKVDFSYAYLFSRLSEEVKKNSLFIYISAPLQDRQKRNEQREHFHEKPNAFSSFHCPDEAMKRFFCDDDFFEALKDTAVDVLYIPNIYTLEHLENRVESLFFTDLRLD